MEPVLPGQLQPNHPTAARAKNRTHDQLVLAAYRWVKNKTACGVAIRELYSLASNGEYPDVIGFGCGMSVLVECKTSRADFLADQRKIFRQHPPLGMGTYRFYCCKPGLLSVSDLPSNWGLLYVNEKGAARTEFNPYNGNRDEYSNIWSGGFLPNLKAETGLMYSVLRRAAKHLPALLANKSMKSNLPPLPNFEPHDSVLQL